VRFDIMGCFGAAKLKFLEIIRRRFRKISIFLRMELSNSWE